MKNQEVFADIKKIFAIEPEDLAAARHQSSQIDDILGFHCGPIEDKLFNENLDHIFSSKRQLWYGLDLQTMQTPYSEMVAMIKELSPQPGEKWVDLGAAYGRMGVVLGILKPLVYFVGYEYVPERVSEGNRIFSDWKLPQAKMHKADLSDSRFELEQADVYFLYDFGSKEDVYSILEQLRQRALNKSIKVIARGRAVKGWILADCPWLYDRVAPIHTNYWSCFQS